MSEQKKYDITVSELITYLYSLDHAKEKEIAKEIHEYRIRCNTNMIKPKKREMAKIEKIVEKDYVKILKTRDEVLKLIDSSKEIPQNIEKLEIVEYMLYRVDLKKTEKVINKIAKKLRKDYENIGVQIKNKIHEIPMFDNIDTINYSEYNTDGTNFAKTKEQYKLEYTEEEKNNLIAKELDIVSNAIEFNSIPIPHEILKNSDRDIQSKMQKFNNIRQKRIRILTSLKDDYKKLINPRQKLCIVDEALESLTSVKDVLTKSEYISVKKALIKRRKKVFRSTNEVRAVIGAKEKKTGILNFNIQQARYMRMENLRNTILEAGKIIKANPITEFEEQLEKLKIAYEREKQFASVIENLDSGRNRRACKFRSKSI